jgi:hypothetical protein
MLRLRPISSRFALHDHISIVCPAALLQCYSRPADGGDCSRRHRRSGQPSTWRGCGGLLCRFWLLAPSAVCGPKTETVSDYFHSRLILLTSYFPVTSLHRSFIVLSGLAEQGRLPAAAPRGGLLCRLRLLSRPPPSAVQKPKPPQLPPCAVRLRLAVTAPPRGRPGCSGR